ncbi:hypothetical protein CF319_g292 [Tilletia indica]|nr:hypothetical protein CF319_g292 [Tilletia indica]
MLARRLLGLVGMSSSVKNKNPASQKRSPFSDVNEDSPTIENVAQLIKKGQEVIRHRQGPGSRPAAGIPDFRSPEAGLYAYLAGNIPKDLYPGHDPEATSSASYTKRASSNASSPRTSTPSSVWPVCLRPSYLGNADEGVDKIAAICGWAEELEKLMEAHHQELKTEHATLLEKQVAKKDASNPTKETVQDVAAH